MRRAAIHVPAVLLCAALAIWSTFPLVLRPGAAIPGAAAGDNVSYLWNLWWLQYAWTHDAAAYFRTPMLFAPFGTQLVLHTHTTLQSLMAWPLLGVATLAAAHNLVLIAGLAANGLAMYALAFNKVRAVVPSLAAGVAFAGSAFVQTHLAGHFNLTHAWVVPLFVLAFIRFLERPAPGAAVFLAAAAAAVTYTDYYFTVYCAAFAAIWTAHKTFAVVVSRSGRQFPALAGASAALLVLVVLLMGAIVATGGVTFMVGAKRISIQTLRNPLTAFWVLLALSAAFRWPPKISIRRREAQGVGPWRAWALALGLYAVLAAPIIHAAVRIFLEGDYVTQRVFWRSSPRGADAATVLLGHPRHFLTGGATDAAHRAVDVGLEQIAWVGLIPLILIARSMRGGRTLELRVWLAVASVFFIWSLGPFLRVAGVETALPLPWAIARYVPMLSNARQPGRAIVMVQLAICMITAIALSRHAGRKAAMVFAALILFENLPAPSPLYALPQRDTVDAWLASHRDGGAVIELPTGLRDGFGDAGALDHRSLVHQTMHERPLVGGFVARLSDRLRDAHARSPFLQGVLLFSKGAGEPGLLAPGAAADAAALGIGYLVVNRDALGRQEALTRSALEQAGFAFLAADGERELYAFAQPNAPR